MSLVRPAMVKDPLTISALIGGDGGEGGEGGVKREEMGGLDRKEYSQLSLVYEVAGEGTVSGYEPPSRSHFALDQPHSANLITFNQIAFGQPSSLDTSDSQTPRQTANDLPKFGQIDFDSNRTESSRRD
jgi:hypothetical protein